jgi:hypothetical protein
MFCKRLELARHEVCLMDGSRLSRATGPAREKARLPADVREHTMSHCRLLTHRRLARPGRNDSYGHRSRLQRDTPARRTTKRNGKHNISHRRACGLCNAYVMRCRTHWQPLQRLQHRPPAKVESNRGGSQPRGAVCAEGRAREGCPLPLGQLWDLRERCKLPCGVRDKAPAAIDF